MTWEETNDTLTKTFSFDDFLESIKFVNSVAVLAEEAKHHPNIHIEYDSVTLTLTTHDQGNTITQKDRDLASQIDHL